MFAHLFKFFSGLMNGFTYLLQFGKVMGVFFFLNKCKAQSVTLIVLCCFVFITGSAVFAFYKLRIRHVTQVVEFVYLYANVAHLWVYALMLML